MSEETFEFEDDELRETSKVEQPSDGDRPVRQKRTGRINRTARGERIFESAEDEKRGLRLKNLDNQQLRTHIGGMSDAALQTLIQVFENAMDHESNTLAAEITREKFKLIPMNANGTGNPALLTTLDLRPEGVDTVLVYVMLFEQNNGQPQFRTMNEGRETYDSLITPEDQLTPRFESRVKSILNLVPPSKTSMTMVNYQIVLQEITRVLQSGKADDAEVRSVASGLINNIFDALSGQRERVLEEVAGIDMADLALTPHSVEGGIRIEVTYDYPVSVIKDGSGIPVAPAINAQLAFCKPNTDDFEEDGWDRLSMGNIAATVDLRLAAEVEQRSSWNRRESEPSPFWEAVIDIRQMGSPAAALPYSLELALYQLAQITPMTNDHRWARGLTPKTTVGNGNGTIGQIVDLGILNLYNPDQDSAAYVDGIGVNTPEPDLMDYLAKTVHGDPAIGLTVPRSNGQSWILYMFEAIATASDSERRPMMQALYRSLNTLTGNAFSGTASEHLFVGSYTPVEYTGAHELIGVWTDEHGNLRPLSEWNVAAFATQLGDKAGAYEQVLDFQSTFEGNNGRSEDYNLSMRFDMIRRHCTSNARVIGTAAKLVFMPEFLAALADSIANSDLEPKLLNAETMLRKRTVGGNAYRRRATSDLGFQGRERGRSGAGRVRRGLNNNRMY